MNRRHACLVCFFQIIVIIIARGAALFTHKHCHHHMHTYAQVREAIEFMICGLRLLGSDITNAGRLFTRAALGGTLKQREVSAQLSSLCVCVSVSHTLSLYLCVCNLRWSARARTKAGCLVGPPIMPELSPIKQCVSYTRHDQRLSPRKA